MSKDRRCCGSSGLPAWLGAIVPALRPPVPDVSGFSDQPAAYYSSAIAPAPNVEVVQAVFWLDALPGPADAWVIARAGEPAGPGLDGWQFVILGSAGVYFQWWDAVAGLTVSPLYPLANLAKDKLYVMHGVCEAGVGGLLKLFVQNAEIGAGTPMVGGKKAPTNLPMIIGADPAPAFSAQAMHLLSISSTLTPMSSPQIIAAAQAILDQTTPWIAPAPLPGEIEGYVASALPLGSPAPAWPNRAGGAPAVPTGALTVDAIPRWPWAP